MHPLTQIKEGYFIVEASAHVGKLSIVNGALQDTNHISLFGEERDISLYKRTLPEGTFELLGIISKDSVDFDLQLLGELSLDKQQADLILNTNDKVDIYKFLLSKGLYWDNPKIEPERSAEYYSGLSMSQEIEQDRRIDEWDELESKKLTGKLVVLKLINP